MNPSPHGAEGKTGEERLAELIFNSKCETENDRNGINRVSYFAMKLSLLEQIKALRGALERIRIEPNLDKIYWYSQNALTESGRILKETQ